MHYALQLPQTVVLVIQSIGGNKDIVNIFTYVFLIFPTFGFVLSARAYLFHYKVTVFPIHRLSSALNDIYINHILKGLCQSEEVRMYVHPTSIVTILMTLL